MSPNCKKNQNTIAVNPALLKYTSECELIKYRCSIQRVCNVTTVSSGHEQLRLLSLDGECFTCSLFTRHKVGILYFSRIGHILIFEELKTDLNSIKHSKDGPSKNESKIPKTEKISFKQYLFS